MPTSPKICASTTLGKFETTDWAVKGCSTYMYILMNHWTNTTGSYTVSSQACSKSHHLCSKYLPAPLTMISNVDELKRLSRSESRCYWTCCWRAGPESVSQISLSMLTPDNSSLLLLSFWHIGYLFAWLLLFVIMSVCVLFIMYYFFLHALLCARLLSRCAHSCFFI